MEHSFEFFILSLVSTHVVGVSIPNFDTIKIAAGNDVILPCKASSSGTVFWGYYSTSQGDVLHISVFGNILNGYAVRFSLRGRNLHIDHASTTDGGLYTYIEEDGVGDKHLVLLSVVGRPALSTTRPTMPALTEVVPPLTTADEKITMSLSSITSLSVSSTEVDVVDASLFSSSVSIFITATSLLIAAAIVPNIVVAVFRTVFKQSAVRRRRLVNKDVQMLLQPAQSLDTNRPLLSSVGTVNIKRDICGLTHISDTLVVVTFDSNKLQVYQDTEPFTRLADIVVEGLTDPRDIAACVETQLLYVADVEGRSIWEVDAADRNKIVVFVETLYKPWTISVRSRQLLVVPFGGNTLYVYDTSQPPPVPPQERQPITVIALPGHLDAMHAIETSPSVYTVCFSMQDENNPDERYNSIVDIDANGKVTRVYKGGPKLEDVHHIALYSDGRVLVAETTGQRVMLLNQDLQVDKTLIDHRQISPVYQPYRLCYVRRTNQLLVAMKNGCMVVYDLRFPNHD